MTHEKAIVYSVIIIAALCFGIILFLLQTIILPFLFALIAMYLLQPLVDCLSRKHTLSELCHKMKHGTRRPQQPPAQEMEPLLPVAEDPIVPGDSNTLSHRILHCPFSLCPRVLAVFLAIALVLGLCSGCGFFVYSSLQTLQAKLPMYRRGARRAFDWASRWLAHVDIDLEGKFVPWAIQYAQSAAPDFLSAVSGYIEKGLVVLIFLVYLLMSPSADADSYSVWVDVNDSVRQFIVLKGCISAVLGSMVAVTLWYLGVECAMVFGLITLFANFIPNVGALFAVAVPAPLVLFDPGLRPQTQILAFLLPFLLHFFFGNFVEPSVLGDRFELHPVVVLLSLIFWALLWGVAGMILAIPIMAVLRIVLSSFESQTAKRMVRALEHFEF